MPALFLRIGAQIAFRLWAMARLAAAWAKSAREIGRSVASLGRGVSVDVRITKNRFPEFRRKGPQALEEAMQAVAETALRSAKRRATTSIWT